MKCGGVSCSKCGYKFYFETEMESVRCLQCGEKLDISSYPDKVDETVSDTTKPGKILDWDIDEGVLL